MAEITVDVEMICDNCRGTLDGDYVRGQLVVEPCDTCMTEQHNEGVVEGQEG